MRRQHALTAQLQCVVTCNSCRNGMVMTWTSTSTRSAKLLPSSVPLVRTMSDEDLTDMLLCSLPKSFDTLIQTQDNNKASFMITCNRLTAEVRRQKLRLNEETPAEMSTAFYSRHDGNAAEARGSRGGQGNRPLGYAAERFRNVETSSKI